MSKVETDFNTLKYNLYEILNVKPDTDDVKIKKNFMRAIKNFHPDKNSDLEEEIYYHLIIANQILLKKDSRKKYDDFLSGTANTFNDLKKDFNKTIKDNFNYLSDEKISNNVFKDKLQELNKKHGYDETKDNISVVDRFNNIQKHRNNIQIDKEDIKNQDDFNSKFAQNKTVGKYKDQIIEYKGFNSELSTYVVSDNYTNLADMDKLYIEDSVQTNKYSSLDRAFTLQPVFETKQERTYEQRMKEYKNQSDFLKSTQYSNKKFDEWVDN